MAGMGRPTRPVIARWARACLSLLLALLIGLPPVPAWAGPVTLPAIELTRTDEGVLLSFNARFELPRPVEDALLKGLPLYFVAEADIYRGRWYWRDKRVAHASRTWRLTWLPLTRTYRMSFGGLSQSYESLPEALAAVRGAARWKIAEPGQLDEGGHHYLEFSYKLDTSQWPRPMQIGLDGQPDWDLLVERSVRLD